MKSSAALAILTSALVVSEAATTKSATSGISNQIESATNTGPIGAGASGPGVIRAQILLDRAGFSPGEIDGQYGGDLKIAIIGFQENHGLNPTGAIDLKMWQLLSKDRLPLLKTYTILAADVKGPFTSIPKDVQEQAKLKAMGYESKEELIAEKFHGSPKMMAALNTSAKFEPGEKIVVPNVRLQTRGSASRVIVSKSKRTVSAVASNGKVLAQYPATIGGPHDPLPIGSWKVTVVQRNPWFNYNPERFWNSSPKDAKATLPPGPNNPAGVVWIGLTKEHYGIHGTPEPGQIRHTESAGCIRLTNWDAADLAPMLRPGTPVILEE